MAEGAEIKIGADATQAKREIGELQGRFSKLGGMFSTGLKMAGGFLAANSLFDLGKKAATGIFDLSEWTGALEDTSLQTGETISDLMYLERALKTTGADAVDAATFLTKFQASLQESHEGSTKLREVLNRLGYQMGDLEGMAPMTVLNLLGKELAALDQGTAAMLSRDAFGKMGGNMLRFFRNTSMLTNAKEELGGLAERVEKSASALGDMSDQVTRFPYLWRAFNLSLFESINDKFGMNWMKDMMDFFTKTFDGNFIEKMVKGGEDLFNNFGKMVNEGGLTGALSGMFKSIGRSLGEGFIEILMETLNGKKDSAGGLLKKFAMDSSLNAATFGILPMMKIASPYMGKINGMKYSEGVELRLDQGNHLLEIISKKIGEYGR